MTQFVSLNLKPYWNDELNLFHGRSKYISLKIKKKDTFFAKGIELDIKPDFSIEIYYMYLLTKFSNISVKQKYRIDFKSKLTSKVLYYLKFL